MPLYSGSRGREIVEYMFVDGGCLREMCRAASGRYFGGDEIEIDYRKLTSGYLKTFYYDAIPVLDSNSNPSDKATAEAQQMLLQKIRQVDGVHVYEGDARRRRKEGLSQKMVDVKLAVDMLTHSFRGNMDRASLLTSDLDFKPLIDALNDDGLYVTLWHPRGKTNEELLAAADARQALDVRRLYAWASDDFRKRHSFPSESYDFFDPYRSYGTKRRDWIDQEHGACQLWESGESRTLVVAPNEKHPSRVLIISSSDLDKLRLFADDIHQLQLPEL